MVQSPLVFVDDPFKGNINPGTSDGAKLYMKATAVTDEEDKFDINIDNAHTFLKHMTRDTNNFGWGVLVRTVETSPAVFKNIIQDHKDITPEDIKRQVYKTWGDFTRTFQTPVPDGLNLQQINPAQHPAHRNAFYRRVRSRMIAKRIIGYLKSVDYEVLKNKESSFTWYGHRDEEIDGPTIL